MTKYPSVGTPLAQQYCNTHVRVVTNTFNPNDSFNHFVDTIFLAIITDVNPKSGLKLFS